MTTTERPAPPHFLGIGVVRGGTTWLWRQIGLHPGAWMTPVKELDYFNRLHPVVGGPPGGEVEVAEGIDPWRETLRRLRWDRLGRYLRGSDPATLAWRWRFYRGRPSPEWYASLFAPARGRVTGDVTPHYSALGDDGVRHVAERYPQTRIVLLLRDPVARDWSHAAHFLGFERGRPIADLTEREILDHIHDPSTRARGDYLPMLARWERHVPPERFFVGFFEDIHERPDELLRSLWRFLDLDDDPALLPPGRERKVNAAGGGAAPAAVSRHLAELHLPALEVLAGRYGGAPERWLARARELLG